jgi:hypothetical protein
MSICLRIFSSVQLPSWYARTPACEKGDRPAIAQTAASMTQTIPDAFISAASLCPAPMRFLRGYFATIHFFGSPTFYRAAILPYTSAMPLALPGFGRFCRGRPFFGRAVFRPPYNSKLSHYLQFSGFGNTAPSSSECLFRNRYDPNRWHMLVTGTPDSAEVIRYRALAGGAPDKPNPSEIYGFVKRKRSTTWWRDRAGQV